MRRVAIGKVSVSGVCIGGNPFSGFSHQTPQRDREMKEYFTPANIKATLRAAEAAGIDTFCGRTDDHIHGILRDYWREGGRIQWLAQVSPEPNQPDSWRTWLKAAAALGAAGAYIHGGIVDFWYANGQFDRFHEALGLMRAAGVAAGFAGHKPEAHAWIRDHLEVDFHLGCWYNPTDRAKAPQHSSVNERWDPVDRARMLEVIHTLRAPVIHYKVFAGGNMPVDEAYEVMGRVVRPTDAVCLGMFVKDDPGMLARNVALFEKHVDKSAR